MLKRIVKFIIQKILYRGLLKFNYSNKIGFKSKFEGANILFENVRFSGKMGYGSYIASNSMLIGKIGRFSSIGPNVSCNNGQHPYTYPYATTHPLFYSRSSIWSEHWIEEEKFEEHRYVKDSKYPIVIGNDCWIGANVFIVGGVTINDGGVVLAGSVVTKDVPSYAVVGGVPAKVLKFRFRSEDISFLQQVKWWEKDINWLKLNAELFTDIDKLKSKINDYTK